MSKVAIIGYGQVRKSMPKIFPDAFIYDPLVEEYQDSQKLIIKESNKNGSQKKKS